MSFPKILADICRERGWKIGFANGCFDLLHAGHLHFLQESIKRCDFFFLAINDDESVAKLKGPQRPRIGVEERIDRVVSTGLVDFVTKFSTEDELAAMMKEISPDILFKSIEYMNSPITGAEYAKEIFYVERVGGHSTTGVLQDLIT